MPSVLSEMGFLLFTSGYTMLIAPSAFADSLVSASQFPVQKACGMTDLSATALSFCGPRDVSQCVRLGRHALYSLSRLLTPVYFYFFIIFETGSHTAQTCL